MSPKVAPWLLPLMVVAGCALAGCELVAPLEPMPVQGGAAADGGDPSSIADVSDRVDPDALAPSWEQTWGALNFYSRWVPSLLKTSPDSLRLFVRSPDNTVVYVDLTRSQRSAPTEDWSPHPYGLISSEPTVVAFGSDDVWLFAMGHTEGAYYSVWDGATWSNWWQAAPRVTTSPVVAVTGPDSALMLALGLDGTLRYRTGAIQAGADWPSDWASADVASSFPPAAVSLADGVHIVATVEGRFLHTVRPLEESQNAETWSWSPLPGVSFESAPLLIARSPSVLDVFGRGTDDCLYWQSQLNGDWLGWVRIARPSEQAFVSNPIAVADSPQSFVVFAKDAQGNAWSRRYSSDTGWTAWRDLGGELSRTVDLDFPGAALAFGERDVRLVALSPGTGLRLLVSNP